MAKGIAPRKYLAMKQDYRIKMKALVERGNKIAHVAKLFEVDRKTVRKWSRRGQICEIVRERKTKIKEKDICKLIKISNRGFSLRKTANLLSKQLKISISHTTVARTLRKLENMTVN